MATRKLDEKLTAQDLRRLIAERHDIGSPAKKSKTSAQEWALFFEFRNGTGYGAAQRYVDAFAFNLYPSKKHWRVAYEIKVSRADFLSELNKPEKRAFGFEISNEFWYVVAPGVAKPEEVPQGCGLLVAHGSKLVRALPALQRDARELTMTEMSSIVRASCRYDVLTSKLWRYQGCELDEDGLNELVNSRKDEQYRSELSLQVDRLVQSKMERFRETIKCYANALQEAGIVPPAWMAPDEDGIYGGWGARSAAEWVRENVKPGPNLKEVSNALAELSKLQSKISGLTTRLDSSLAEASAATQSAIEQVRKLSD